MMTPPTSTNNPWFSRDEADRYEAAARDVPHGGAGLLQIHQRICRLAGVRHISVHGLRSTALSREPAPMSRGDDDHERRPR